MVLEKKQVTLIVSILLLAIPLTFATPSLVITPETLNVTQTVGETQTYTIELHNNGTTDINNLSFTPVSGYTFTPITLLTVGQKLTINVVATINTVVNNLVTSIVSYSYITSQPSNPVTYTIQVNDTGFMPNLQTLKDGDTIIWENIDNKTHVISSVSGETFTYTIASNSTATKTFNTIGINVYIDDDTFQVGQLDVLDNSEQIVVQNPLLNVNFNLKQVINSTISNIDLILFNHNIDMEWDESVESAVSIKNNANIDLLNVNLSDSLQWFNFTQTMFNISSGNTEVVTFDIFPSITLSSETNKTYNNTVTMTSNNGIALNQTMEIFIEYSNNVSLFSGDVDEQIQNLIGNGTIEDLKELLAILEGYNNNTNETNIVYLQANDTIEVGVLKQQLKDFLETYGIDSGELHRVFNVVSVNDEYLKGLNASNELMASEIADLNERQKKIDERSFALSAVIIMALFLVGGTFLLKKYVYNKDKNPLTPQEGTFDEED